MDYAGSQGSKEESFHESNGKRPTLPPNRTKGLRESECKFMEKRDERETQGDIRSLAAISVVAAELV